MKSPFVKFLNHTCAYIVFLMFIFMATTRGGSGTPMLDLACKGVSGSLPDSVVYTLILVWVLGKANRLKYGPCLCRQLSLFQYSTLNLTRQSALVY